MDDLVTDETTTFLVHRTYAGDAAETTAALTEELPALAASGYQVVGQSWEPGRRPWWWWLLAVLLMPFVVGIALLVYFLLNPPPGRLTVSLTWTGFPDTPEPGSLLQPGAVAQVLGKVQASSGSEVRDELAAQLEALQEYLAALAADSRATLGGDASAAGRLRRCLAGDATTQLTADEPHELPGSGLDSVVDRDQLALLAAGTTWAATSSAEAQGMLSTLAHQLAPLAAVQAALAPGVPPVQMQMMMAGGGLGLPVLGGGGLPGLGIPGLGTGGIGGGLPTGGIGGLIGLGPRPRPFLPFPIDWFLPKPRPVWPFPFPPGDWDHKPIFVPPFLYDTDKICAQLAVFFMFTIQKTSTKYRITSISPAATCAGGTILLRGTGFGPGGVVLFPSIHGPGAHLPANPITWTDTEITVIVPGDAAPGEIRLQIIEKTLAVCRILLTVFRLGTGIAFTGGQSRVFSITVNGEPPPSCLPPDTDVSIEWVTTVAASHAVSIAITTPGRPPTLVNRMAVGADSVTYRTPNVSTPTTLTVTVIVSGGCHSAAPARTETFAVSVPAKLSVRGIEVTQGVQHFQLASPVPPSVVTVAGKDTIVRVYVGCDRNGFAQDQLEVMGSLRIENGPTLMPVGVTGTTTARRWTSINRNLIGDTLNFRIPAAWCVGTQRLFVNVWGTDEGGTHHAYGDVFWSWEVQPALKVRYVRIRDGRPGSATPGQIPSDAQARAIVTQAFDQLPSPPLDIAPAWLTEWNTSQDWLDAEDGQQNLLNHVNDQHNCTLWESVWPWSDPCPANDGAKWVGVYFELTGGGKAKRDGNTCVVGLNPLHAGHELAHTLGLKHVLTGDGDTVPQGPYDTLPINGFIIDTPVDPTALVTLPVPTFDLMSYARSRWISPHNWDRLRGII